MLYTIFISYGFCSAKPSTLFDVEEREEMLSFITRDLENVQVIKFEGLAVDCAIQNECQMIIRSFRNISDVDYELVMVDQNKKVSGIETIFMFPDSEYRFIPITIQKSTSH